MVGDYTLLKDLVVRKALSLESSKVVELKAGSSVTILEVAALASRRKTRGRVLEPAGWITLRDTASGAVLASRSHITPDASNLKAGHALLAMSRLTMRLDESLESDQVTHVGAEKELEVLRVGAGRRIQVRDGAGRVGWVSLASEDGEPLLKQEAGGERGVVLVVAGAGGIGAGVNGRYRWVGAHEGAGLYQQVDGEAVIYRNVFWKLNHHASTSGWYYAAPFAKGPRPPLAGWECHVESAEPPPCVSVAVAEDSDCISVVAHDVAKKAAATKIQAVHRGRKSRTEMQGGQQVPGIPMPVASLKKDRTGPRAKAIAERSENSVPQWIQRIKVESAENEVAATRIQAAARGQQARRLSVEKREAIKLAGGLPGRTAFRAAEEQVPPCPEEVVPSLDETTSQRGFKLREASWQNEWCSIVMCCR